MAFRNGKYQSEIPSIERIRKISKILVIDDLDFPHLSTFDRDGYHIEQWSDIKNMRQLTDGDYPLILLDVNGVGRNESPDKQGIGVLEHIKKNNPSQAVILYSADTTGIENAVIVSKADAILSKGSPYLLYKEKIDDLLMSRADPAVFIESLNKALGREAIKVPKAVGYASYALRSGNTTRLRKYLSQHLEDPEQIKLALTVINIGIQTLKLFM